MFGYPSEEIKKLTVNLHELNFQKLRNKELVGLFLLGKLSYKDIKNELGLDDRGARDLIDGLAFQLSRNITRDDEEMQVPVWEATKEENK